MEWEGDVFSHDENVRDCDAGEDEVDGVPAQVLVSEDDDVEEIGECTKDTDNQR